MKTTPEDAIEKMTVIDGIDVRLVGVAPAEATTPRELGRNWSDSSIPGRVCVTSGTTAARGAGATVDRDRMTGDERRQV